MAQPASIFIQQSFTITAHKAGMKECISRATTDGLLRKQQSMLFLFFFAHCYEQMGFPHRNKKQKVINATTQLMW